MGMIGEDDKVMKCCLRKRKWRGWPRFQQNRMQLRYLKQGFTFISANGDKISSRRVIMRGHAQRPPGIPIRIVRSSIRHLPPLFTNQFVGDPTVAWPAVARPRPSTTQPAPVTA